MQFLLLGDNSINVLRNKVNLHFLWPNHPHCAHYSKSALTTGCMLQDNYGGQKENWGRIEELYKPQMNDVQC